MSDSNPDSIVTLSQSPPSEYQDSQVQWISPDNSQVGPQDVETQWNIRRYPQPETIPVTTATESRLVFINANGTSTNNGYHGTYMTPSNGTMNHLNGLILPNGSRVVNGNIINGGNIPGFRPRVPTVMSSFNNWVNPNPNAGRLIPRPNWNGTTTKPSARKPKRIRTAFTSQQMMELEQEYARTRYLDRTRRIELAEYLHLNERTIKIWFQNRRMKEKKDKAESLEEEEATSTTDSSEMGIPVGCGQIPIEGMYTREVYVDQYAGNSMSSSMQGMPAPVQQAVSSSLMNGYPAFPPDHYEERRHIMISHQSPAYSGQVMEFYNESPPDPETEAPGLTDDGVEQSWDVSWIKSMQMSDDC